MYYQHWPKIFPGKNYNTKIVNRIYQRNVYNVHVYTYNAQTRGDCVMKRVVEYLELISGAIMTECMGYVITPQKVIH